MAMKDPGKPLSVLSPSLAGHAGEAAAAGLAVHWLNHGQDND